MRYLIVFLAFISFITAANLEVSANSFYHKDGENRAEFVGNVVVKEGESKITCNKIIVLLDDKGEAKEYIATGSVKFVLKSPKRYIKGRSNKLRYLPLEDKYYLEGNVYIKDVLNDREIYGDEIVIDNKHGSSYAKSRGNKKVKFIFKVKSK